MPNQRTRMAEKRKSEPAANAKEAVKHQKMDPEAPEAAKEYETSNEFKQLLIKNPVESLAYRKKGGVVFFVDRSDKISDVFQGLVKQNFLSVPVLQKTKSKWYGFVEIADIVHFYVEHFGDQLGDEGKAVWETIAQREGFMDKTVDDVMKYPLTRRNPFHPITAGYSLFYAIEILAREPQLHRVPVIDRERNLKSVLSQSQIVEFISENMELLGSIRHKPLGEIKRLTRDVVSVKEDDRAIDAFKIMQEKNVGGVAVVDEEGKMVGALSMRDLKAVHVGNDMFHRLFQKVRNFILHLRQEFQERDGRPKYKQTLTEDETLEEAIKVLVNHNIHRAFIVDSKDSKKPIGVISLQDILLEIITH